MVKSHFQSTLIALSRRDGIELTGECTYFESRLNDCKERVIGGLPRTSRGSRHRQCEVTTRMSKRFLAERVDAAGGDSLTYPSAGLRERPQNIFGVGKQPTSNAPVSHTTILERH